MQPKPRRTSLCLMNGKDYIMHMTQPADMEQDARWHAVQGRDAQADGRFVYAVKTTGIYCRPSCPARRPAPGNVAFYATPDAAEAAGFRACLRCHPRGVSTARANAALIEAACRMIEAAETPLATADLAHRIGFSTYHFHRQFKAITGMTPQAYAAGHRAALLRDGLAGGQSVTQAIHAAGFNAPSRFYDASDDILGMRPRAWRDGGAGETIRFALGQCSLGAILVAASDRGVCAISLGDTPEPLLAEFQGRFSKAHLIGDDAGFGARVAQVAALIEAPDGGADLAAGLALDIRGTVFQLRVWQALRQIAPGETISYRELAQRIGAPKATRAVASACAANPLAVAIPCHRVVRSDGALSGYRWGVERKAALIARETAAKG